MRLYLKYFSIILRSQMQFKKSFVFVIIGQIFYMLTGFFSIYFMLMRFNTVNGFTFSQIMLCYGVLLASFSLVECFLRGFDSFTGIISSGEFDRIMVRPRNEIFQVLAARIEFSRIGRLLVGAGMLIYAIRNSGIVWTPDKIFTLSFMMIGGVFVFSGLFIIYAGICFFSTEGLEFMSFFIYGNRTFGRYPLSIYGEGILKFLTYVIPIALFQYYPFLYLIGQSQNKFYMFLPLIAALYIFPCLLFWKFGVKHYKSTGS